MNTRALQGFLVKHYAGWVEYTTRGWLDKLLGSLSHPRSERAGCGTPLLKELTPLSGSLKCQLVPASSFNMCSRKQMLAKLQFGALRSQIETQVPHQIRS